MTTTTPTISDVLARIEALATDMERRLGIQEELLVRIADELERVGAVAERNAVVAETYGGRAASVFAVVDTVGTFIERVNPLTYVSRFAIDED
jgi:hypothetical protein